MRTTAINGSKGSLPGNATTTAVLFAAMFILAVPAPQVVASDALAAGKASGSMIGFFDGASVARERRIEDRFDSKLRREDFDAWMKHMSAHPHHLGSPYDQELSRWAARLFESWGYQTSVSEYQVLFSTPKTNYLELMGPERFVADLTEKPAGNGAAMEARLPPYACYSIDGDVTAEIVYVNYGRPVDYEVLAEHGVDAHGKIVIARYGACFRAVKPKCAAQHGAVGCIVYSDPRDDGYFRGDVFPEGSWRNGSGVQRGTYADIMQFPGDPLTPGVAALGNAKRLAISEAPTLTKIPCLPISYSNAEPLARSLRGPVAPEDWRGSPPLTYHLGPGPAVRLKVQSNWQTVTARDVIAVMPGSDLAEQWILRGNHYDAWVEGAEDPISGAVCLLETARAASELAKEGFKPRRTIMFCLWDGEEPGLIGSTEWVEEHLAALRSHAVIDINTDDTRRGILDVKGCDCLERLANEAANDVRDPEKHVAVSERLRAERIFTAPPAERGILMAGGALHLEPLGAGSDFTAFHDYAGIPSLNVEFAGEEGNGSYHSVQDSYENYLKFGDPNFDYEIALAQITGRILLRAADSDVIPMEFNGFASAIERYSTDLARSLDALREGTKLTNEWIAGGIFDLVSDPREPVMPRTKAGVPHLNLAPLQNAVTALNDSSRKFESARTRRVAERRPPSRVQERALDQIFQRIEQTMIYPAGLPHHSWYKNLTDAPGLYTGYSAKTLPGAREAIEERNWTEAEKQIEIVARALREYARQIDAAAALLGDPTRASP